MDLNFEFVQKFLGKLRQYVDTLWQYGGGVNPFSYQTIHFVRLFCVEVEDLLGL